MADFAFGFIATTNRQDAKGQAPITHLHVMILKARFVVLMIWTEFSSNGGGDERQTPLARRQGQPAFPAFDVYDLRWERPNRCFSRDSGIGREDRRGGQLGSERSLGRGFT